MDFKDKVDMHKDGRSREVVCNELQSRSESGWSVFLPEADVLVCGLVIFTPLL